MCFARTWSACRLLPCSRSAPGERARHWPRPTRKQGMCWRRVDHAAAAQRRRAGGHPRGRGRLRAAAGGRRHHAVRRAPRGRHLGRRAGAAPGQGLRAPSGCGRVAGVAVSVADSTACSTPFEVWGISGGYQRIWRIALAGGRVSCTGCSAPRAPAGASRAWPAGGGGGGGRRGAGERAARAAARGGRAGGGADGAGRRV